MATSHSRLLALSLTAVVTLICRLLAAQASQPFNPSLEVAISDPNLSANSTVATVISVPSGNHALSNWALDLPVGWRVAEDTAIPYGNTVAEGTMSVDVDCNGSIENFGFFSLSNQPSDPSAVGEWQGQITSWWPFTITVDGSTAQGFDMNADLTNLSEFHALCAPQTVALTVFGRSSPGNAVVLTNPSTTGTYTWTSPLVSLGAEHTTQITDVVCLCPNPDTDGDGVIDEANCGSDPNDPTKRPERIDGVFTGEDDDGDMLVDEPLPPGGESYDCDGDGYTGIAEDHVFAPSARGDQDPCGGSTSSPIGWPADLSLDNQVSVGDVNSFIFPLRALDDGHGAYSRFGHPIPDADATIALWDLDPSSSINVGDINSFIFPLRPDGSFNKFGHPVPDSDPDIARWDLDPSGSIDIGDVNSFIFPLRSFNDGHGLFAKFGHSVPDVDPTTARWDVNADDVIDLGDLNALNPAILAATSRPPMFGGQPAFFTDPDGPGPMSVGQCPWPP